MSSSFCGFGNLLLPVKSLTDTDAMADRPIADDTFLSASMIFICWQSSATNANKEYAHILMR